jgi:hypothetical protein
MSPPYGPPEPEIDPNSIPNPYRPQTTYNTKPDWMSSLGNGVKADLDGMTDYAGNLDKIKSNFMSLGRSVTGPMKDTATEAFSAENNGLPMTSSMLEVAANNLKELTFFFGQLTQGVLNVAMAAQTVANTYGDTDATNAAKMNSINFAFGNRDAAPDSIPPSVLKQLKSWSDMVKENPSLTVNVPDGGVDGAQTTTDGNVTTTTMKVDGHDFKIVTTTVSYPGFTMVTSQTYMDGKVINTRTTNHGPTGTHTTETRTVYPEGKAPQTQVVSEGDESTSFPDATTTQHNQSNTTYTYDTDGTQHGSTSTSSSQVGDEHLPDNSDPLEDDPAQQKREEIMPPPEPDPDEVILAPGAPGETYTPSGSTATA